MRCLLKIERKLGRPATLCRAPELRRAGSGLNSSISSYCTGSPALVKNATVAGSKKPTTSGRRLKRSGAAA